VCLDDQVSALIAGVHLDTVNDALYSTLAKKAGVFYTGWQVAFVPPLDEKDEGFIQEVRTMLTEQSAAD
jgi:hypothetical protein